MSEIEPSEPIERINSLDSASLIVITSALMSCKWMVVLALALAGAAHAAPSEPAPSDDIALLLQERGLIPHLREMRESVATHTSNLITTAMSMVGVPYRRGGNDVATGLDCSGFVRKVYADVAGHLLPRRAVEQAHATTKIDKGDLQPGDLVFFNTMRRAFSHVGIYLGDGQFIHAPRSGSSVRVESMNTKYWTSRFNGARRVQLADGTSPDLQTLRAELTTQP